MSELVEELKQEHAEIIDMLTRVKEMRFSSREGQTELLLAKTRLLAHLKKEDEEFHPVLREAAEGDERLGRILDVFANDMEEVSGFAIQFFEKYSKGGTGITFARDFGDLVAFLRQRIRSEESVLYAEYEKLNLPG